MIKLGKWQLITALPGKADSLQLPNGWTLVFIKNKLDGKNGILFSGKNHLKYLITLF